MTEGLSTRRYRGLPPEARQADRQQRFRAAGLELFATVGYLNSSVPEICRRAGLSTRQFYAEFSSREALLIDLYERFQAQARGAVRSALEEAADRDRHALIVTALTAYFEAIAGDARVARLALIETVGLTETVEQARAEVRLRWLALVEETLPLLTVDPGDAGDAARRAERAAMAVTALSGALESLALRWAAQDPRTDLSDTLSIAVPVAESLLTTVAAGPDGL